jgi:hypothetical protein
MLRCKTETAVTGLSFRIEMLLRSNSEIPAAAMTISTKKALIMALFWIP